jgi:hypothetical protein
MAESPDGDRPTLPRHRYERSRRAGLPERRLALGHGRIVPGAVDGPPRGTRKGRQLAALSHRVAESPGCPRTLPRPSDLKPLAAFCVRHLTPSWAGLSWHSRRKRGGPRPSHARRKSRKPSLIPATPVQRPGVGPSANANSISGCAHSTELQSPRPQAAQIERTSSRLPEDMRSTRRGPRLRGPHWAD